MAIDTTEPLSDGWWLQRLYEQLRAQQKRCQALQDRFEGNPPLPYISDNQKDAVKWFVKKSRTNFERLIVNAVKSRMRIVGIRTAASTGDGGDEEADAVWKAARMPVVTRDIHKMMLAMSQAYAIPNIIGGELLVTAEDPRLCTAITDPANPYKVLAGLKMFHDDVADQDMAYLYLPGRVMVAKKPRKVLNGAVSDIRFNPRAYSWDEDIVDSLGTITHPGLSGAIEQLAKYEDGEVVDGDVAIVPYVNEDGMAEYEPYVEILDRINQQILQRMTIATIQAFRQRAFKGLPPNDPNTGEKIDYDDIFVADPGAIWNIPAAAEIWESEQVDLGPILMAIRDDVKDLAATSGTPLYSITPDAANGSAEGASLQRETLVFKVEERTDRVSPSHAKLTSLMFKMLGDEKRADLKSIEMLWAPADRVSMSERANAIAQTTGVMSRHNQLTRIWGMTPAEAKQNLSELTEDFILDQQYAVASRQSGSGSNNATAGGTSQDQIRQMVADAVRANAAAAS